MTQEEIGGVDPDGLKFDSGVVSTGDNPVLYTNKVLYPSFYDFTAGTSPNKKEVHREYTYDELIGMGMPQEWLMEAGGVVTKIFNWMAENIPAHKGKVTEQ